MVLHKPVLVAAADFAWFVYTVQQWTNYAAHIDGLDCCIEPQL